VLTRCFVVASCYCSKTIQTAALLAALFSMRPSDASAVSPFVPFPPVLLITPATILHQWQEELSEWCPDLKVQVCHGGEKEKAFEAIKERRANILITSYEVSLGFKASL
jgi:SNF2 family DNA or RNA helicase